MTQMHRFAINGNEDSYKLLWKNLTMKSRIMRVSMILKAYPKYMELDEDQQESI